MMKKILIYTTAIFALLACNNEVEYPAVKAWNGEINIYAEAVSRATVNIKKDVTVSVYVNKTETNESVYGKNDFVTDDNGKLNSDETLYFPKDGKNVDVYGFINANSGEQLKTFTLDLPLDQKSFPVQSDLMLAKTADVTASPDEVKLTFKHLMSNVSVALKSGLGTPNLSGVTVTVLGLKTSVEVNPFDATVVAKGESKEISLSTVVTDNFETNTNFAQSIVAPQMVAGNTDFIKVVYNERELLYKVPATGLNLESGKKYIYQFIVNDSSNEPLVLVSKNIQNWVDGTEFNESAVKE